MAGKKLIVTRKVPGSTILEVVMSMAVILVVFSIAMMIYGNVMRSSLSVTRLSAEALLRERLIFIEQNPAVGNASITSGNFQVVQEVQPYNKNTHLEQVHLVALDRSNVKAAEIYQVIEVP